MRTYCVLLHIFAAFLLCDYGMFSMPSPSPSEMSTTAISNTSDSNTTVTTAKSITVGNDLRPSEPGSGDDQSNDSFPADPRKTERAEYGGLNESVPDDPRTTKSSEDFSNTENRSSFGVTFSTAHPKHDPKEDSGSPEGSGSLTGGVIILILILILIGFLLGILYVLRKKGRSYSFDLTSVGGPASANDYVDTPLRSDQQGISYEQTNKDLPVCLDYAQEDKSEEKTNPIANGSAGEKTEQTPTNENDEQNLPEENSFSSDSSLVTPMSKVEFNLDLDLLGGESDLNGLTEAEATDVAQNENNNNVTNAGRETAEEIFTEISLDEPKENV